MKAEHEGNVNTTGLNPRSEAAQRGWQKRREKAEARSFAAQKAAVTRKDNQLRKYIESGYHSADTTFNKYINEAKHGNRKF